MEAIYQRPFKIDAGASSSSTGDNAPDSDAPSLRSALRGRQDDLLELVRATDIEADAGASAVYPLLAGVPIAPLPLLPHEKGKARLRPLWGEAGFALRLLGAGVYQLSIQRSGGLLEHYYCNMTQATNQDGWYRSYRTLAAAAAYDDARWGRNIATSQSWGAICASLSACAPMQPAYAPVKSVALPTGMRVQQPIRPLAIEPLHVGVPKPAQRMSAPSDFTAEEARYCLMKLGRGLTPGSQLVWGAHRQQSLLAVVQVPRTTFGRLLRDRARLWDCQIFRVALGREWEAPLKARIMGGGLFPPVAPGQSTTVETYDEPPAQAGWVMELAISEDGSVLATINDRAAAVVDGFANNG